ncbi:hypothetical protein TrVFT333_006260 [Trichoderma virens FT-333]|nr:hypothetical protein TrVFT333_006260 [Trichoderma virens FT-333]
MAIPSIQKKWIITGAGQIGCRDGVAIGSKVPKREKGDRVVTLFNPDHQAGPATVDAHLKGGLGVFEETWLVRVASNLSYLEGASLFDAGATAWNALFGGKPLKPGEWVLTQGTGGFAKAAGAKLVATTSSAEKSELLKRLGADHVINYRDDPNWGKTARKLTPNQGGFGIIVEAGGTDTMSNCIQAIKLEGVITVIWVVT